MLRFEITILCAAIFSILGVPSAFSQEFSNAPANGPGVAGTTSIEYDAEYNSILASSETTIRFRG